MMPGGRSNSPEDLYDFDINFRLEHLVRRGEDRNGCFVWSPTRWQNLILIAFGLPLPAASIFLIARVEGIIEDNPIPVLVLLGLLMALLAAVSLVVLAAGLFHWPRLIIDPRERVMTVRRRFSRRIDASLRFDDIDHLEIDLLWSEGGEPSGAPSRVLYAVLRDGRRANIAISPSEELIEELRRLT